MAAPTSKLLNIGKNPALRNLIHSNLLRTTTGAATANPISQALMSTAESQIPIQLDREDPNLKTDTPTAAEILKTMNPGMHQSERILKFQKRPPIVDDDYYLHHDDDDSDGDFRDDSDGYVDDWDCSTGSDSDQSP